MCWAVAAAIGLVFLVVAWAVGGMGFFKALIWGIVLFILVGLALSNWLCGRMMAPGKSGAGTPSPAPKPVAPAPTAPTPAVNASVSTTPVPTPAAQVPSVSTSTDGGAVRPAALAAPEGGKADDLKRIKGIGPKLEALCHSLGVYHFSQIAGWTAAEVAWMDDNLEGFKGRVTRDDWVAQAKLLSAGGETAFSKRVDKGGVY